MTARNPLFRQRKFDFSIFIKSGFRIVITRNLPMQFPDENRLSTAAKLDRQICCFTRFTHASRSVCAPVTCEITTVKPPETENLKLSFCHASLSFRLAWHLAWTTRNKLSPTLKEMQQEREEERRSLCHRFGASSFAKVWRDKLDPMQSCLFDCQDPKNRNLNDWLSEHLVFLFRNLFRILLFLIFFSAREFLLIYCLIFIFFFYN